MQGVAFRQHRGTRPPDANAGASRQSRTEMPTQPTFTCATCDDAIAGRPTFHLGLAFCCAGCAADGPCMCTYDHEELHDSPSAAVVVDFELLAVADDERSPVGARG